MNKYEQHASAATLNAGIDWDSYPVLLDMQADLTPEYWENVDALLENSRTFFDPERNPNVRICDIGAGTGNFCRAIAHQYPRASITHLEPTPNMNARARQKYDEDRLSNISIVEAPFASYEWQPEEWDIIVCVNTLYMLTPHQETLQKIFTALKPGGLFFVVDFGRKQVPSDWFWYFLGNAVKGINTWKYLKAVPRFGKMATQAKSGSQTQVEGLWWTHTTEEFGEALTEAGFTVKDLKPCYRDYADMAICTR